MKDDNYLKKELYELIKTDESIFDFIQESALDGLWYWDLEKPEEEWMNPQFWAVLGYNHKEMPHKSSAWQDIIHPADLKLATENFIKHCENPDYPYNQTVRYTHKNGSTVWIRCRGLAIRDKNGKPVRMLGAHQDITSYNNSELLLQKNTTLLRNSQLIAKIGSWELDLATNEVLWTEELYNMFGFDPSLPAPPYTEHMELFTPESWEQLSSSLALTSEQGIPYELELETILKNGGKGWIWVRGEAVFDKSKNIIGLRGLAQDITARKQAEVSLRESKEKLEAENNAKTQQQAILSTALATGKMGVWSYDVETDMFHLTEEFYQIFKSTAEAEGGPLMSAKELAERFIPKEFRPIVEHEIGTALQTKEPSYSRQLEHPIIFADGTDGFIRVSLHVLKDKEGRPKRVIGVNQDITENKNIELEKEALTKRLKYALDASGDGIWDWTPANGKTVYSKAWVEMLGYNEGEIASLASEWSDRLHPDDIEWVFAAISKVTKTPENGDTLSHEYRFRNKKGDYLWILNRAKVVERNEKGEATRVVGTHTNITEQKNKEDKILASEQFQRLILDVTPSPIFLKDRDGRYTGANSAFESFFGKSKKDLIGKSAFEIGPSKLANIYHTKDTELFENLGTQKYETQVLNAKGELRDVEFRKAAIEDGNGAASGLIGIILDVTERKKAESAAKESEEKYRSIFEANSDAITIFLINPSGLPSNMVEINDAAIKLFGYTKTEMLNMGPNDLEINATDEKIKSRIQEVQVNGFTHFETAVRHKGGHEINVEVKVQVISYNNMTGLMNIVRDITERKKAEKALKESELRFSVAIEGTEAGIWDWDMVKNRVVYSKQWKAMLGYEEAEIENSFEGWKNLWHPDDAQEIERSVTEHMNGVRQKYEVIHRCRHKNGGWRWIMTRGKILKDTEGRPYRWVGTNVDITKEKEAEIESRESKLRLSLATQAGGVGVWDYDIVANVLTWDDQMFGLYGVKREDFSNEYEAWVNGVHEADRERGDKEIELAIRGEKEFNTEFRVQHPNGRVRIIRALAKVIRDEEGNALRMIGTNWDITREKETLKQIEEVNQKLKSVFDGVQDVIWSVEADTLKTIFVTPSAVDFYGYPIDQWYSNPQLWSDVIIDEHKGITSEILRDLQEHGFSETEFRIKTKSGIIRWVKNRSKSVIENGILKRFEGVVIDITKEKETLKQIEEAKEQAEKASKAKSEFLANMSHEIRTPLNSVIGFTDLLKNTRLSSVQQQYVNNVNVSGHLLLGIINDILDFSKIEAGMLELDVIKADILQLLENSIDIVKFTAEDKGLELILDIDPFMPRFANIDPVRVKQVLTNLLGNAVKFTKKGEVELKVGFQALDGEQGKLSFSVRDTGIGIGEAQKENLFRAFSQADSSTTRKYGGTGLGLIISQKIAEKMGSRINFDSTLDAGTTFFFDITTDFEEGEKLDPSKITQVNRCLVIDDNARNRLILEQMLKQWQIESDSCDNGLEALKRMETSKFYDVIICDYDIPYMNGIETIRIMKEKLNLSTKKQPVILLHSSLDNIQLDQRCEELGIRFRLNKPVKSHDLFRYLCNLHQELESMPLIETEQIFKAGHTSEKMKIIIAEDEPLNMLLIKTILFQFMPNSEIYEAKNGLEVVKLSNSITPDLIFMDVHMPDLDGIEATKQIREMEVNTPKLIPIIALTAGALKEEKDNCFAAGMDDFLTKPIEPHKIQAVLSKYFPQGKSAAVVLQDVDVDNEIHFGYSELVRSLRNDMDTVRELISSIIVDMPTRIDQLEQTCKEMDTTKIKSIAHSIKGTSLSMRCKHLANIAGNMESDAKDNSLENMGVLLTELKAEWEIVENIFLQKMK